MAADPSLPTAAPATRRLVLGGVLLAWLCLAPFAPARGNSSADPPAGAEAREDAQPAGKPTLRDIATSVAEDGSLAVDARGVGFVDGEIREAVKGGVEARIEFEVELERQRTFWFNETVSSIAFRRCLKYDSLKDEYQVTFEGQEGKPEVVKDLATARSRIEVLKGITLPIEGARDPSSTYFLRVRAQFDSPDLALPSAVRRLLFFAPEWGFDTGWVVTEVKF